MSVFCMVPEPLSLGEELSETKATEDKNNQNRARAVVAEVGTRGISGAGDGGT